MTKAKVHITKLAAAQRQLKAAIRMFFSGEDELAIHTVASSAYQIMADLKKARGQDEVADFYRTAIFYAVRAYRRGVLPNKFTDDPKTMRWIQGVAERLPEFREDAKIEDHRVLVSPKVARDYWSKRKKAYNFLKHARWDANKHLLCDEVDNFNLLAQSLASYMSIAKDALSGKEEYALFVYIVGKVGADQDWPEDLKEIAAFMDRLNDDDQLRFCLDLIHKRNDM